ncbi:MAG: hypothetical protein K0S14_1223 [Thermomicrobiales bacterium]|jgi:hypothetical protein|nr:hypothetical protein [Thermomicrobiales bacterium]
MQATWKVAVLVPAGDQVAAPFANALANLLAFSTAAAVMMKEDGRELEIALFMLPGTYIDQAREQLARQALDWGATHMLWLDSDMIFPKDALLRLMRHNQYVVGANYSTRRTPPRPVATLELGDSKESDRRLYTTEEDTGLQEVEHIGFGCVLTHANVFHAQADRQQPFFLCSHGTIPGRGFVGEDVYFCHRAREKGFHVMVDHDLSKLVAHVGVLPFLMDHALLVREDVEPKPAPKIEVVGA